MATADRSTPDFGLRSSSLSLHFGPSALLWNG